MPAEEQLLEPAAPREETQERDIDVSVLDLPDEEFIKQGGENTFELNMQDIGKPPEETDAGEEQDEPSSEESEDYEDGDLTDSSESEVADDESDDEAEDTELGETDDPETEELTTEESEEEEETDSEEEEPDTEDVDYKAEYQRILSPFKANGKDIQVDNIDDAIRLM